MSKIEKPLSLKLKESAGFNFVGPDYTNLGIIGSGSYGEVYKVRHKQTKKDYAIKIYKKIFRDPILAIRTLREICILRRIQHNRIIKIHTIIPPKDYDNFDTLCIVLEYLPFDLKKLC